MASAFNAPRAISHYHTVDKELVEDVSTNSNVSSSMTGSSVAPTQQLGFIQTTSLMLQGSFANGSYFSTPYFTLALIRSKRICLLLWALGGIYAGLGMAIFLEYGTAFPYTGGALLYLDRVFHRPKLLATILFSTWFIVFQTTAGMSRLSAQTILSLATGLAIPQLDVRLVKFTAIAIQTIVCLLLYFFRRATFTLNTLFAAYKIFLMLSIFIIGTVYSGNSNSGLRDFNIERPDYSAKNTLSAFVYIVASSQGYENANYVTGEIREGKKNLRRSGIAAVCILTVFNILVTFALLSVADYQTLTTLEAQGQSVYYFGKIISGSSRSMQAACLPATIGSLVFLTYTYSRVKQAIAAQGLIPFSDIFGRHDTHFDSPRGGLFLHWLFTVALIISLGDNVSPARVLFNGIAAYGYQLMFLFLASGLFIVPDQTYLTNRYIRAIVAFVFIVFNLVTLIVYALPTKLDPIPRFFWPVSTAVVAIFSVMYWMVLRFLQAKGQRIGLKVDVHVVGDDDIPDHIMERMRDAEIDGTGRRISCKTFGLLALVVDKVTKTRNIVLELLAY